MKSDFALCLFLITSSASVLGCGDLAVEDADGVDGVENLGSTAQEIYLGESSVSNLAVVELYRNGGSYCTGFFITNRHIVTAAHCTDSYYTTQWYRIRVKTGYNSFKYIRDASRIDNWVLMAEYTPPAWNFGNGSAVGDTAILTLPSTAWYSVPTNQARLRISTAPPPVGQLLSIWGWGRRDPRDSSPAGDLLTGWGFDQIDVRGVTGTGTGVWFWTYANNRARTCDGDSGGPATRLYDGYYIATGSHGGPPATYTQRCVEPPWRMDWATLHDKASWIESVLRISYGSTFSCNRYGSGANAYMRCF